MTTKLKDFKDLGWKKCYATRNDFDGAILEVKTEEEETVAILFGDDIAYVVSDDEGLYPATDLDKHVIKESGIPHLTGNFLGAEPLARFEAEDENPAIMFYDTVLDKYNINTFEVRAEIEKRLRVLLDIINSSDANSALG